MKFSTLSKAGFAASVCAALTAMPTGASAGTLQDTIFAKVEPSARDRMFFRLSYINVNVKTTSKDAYDVTGPVYAKGDIAKYLPLNNNNQSTIDSGFVDANDSPITYDLINSSLDASIAQQALLGECPSISLGLGTPCGIKAKSSARLSTVGLSIGYFLDEGYSWALEAIVLGAPLNASVYGDGRNKLNGQKIIETKMLPPIVSLGKYFGAANDVIRPYLGLAASYAIFFDTKATENLNKYQGGGAIGDTTVRIKNVMGFGPLLGLKLQSDPGSWSLSFSAGKLRYKTEATLTTRNTTISSQSAVLGDYGAYVNRAIVNGTNLYAANSPIFAGPTPPNGYTPGQAVLLTDALMCDLAKAKNNGNNACNIGTYVRKAPSTLDGTLFMLSVGRSF